MTRLATARLVASTLVLATLAAVGAAEARGGRGGSNWSETTVTTSGPERGYSGFVSFGAKKAYCDYVRFPNRECFVDGRGREVCKIVSWDLKQRCY